MRSNTHHSGNNPVTLVTLVLTIDLSSQHQSHTAIPCVRSLVPVAADSLNQGSVASEVTPDHPHTWCYLQTQLLGCYVERRVALSSCRRGFVLRARLPTPASKGRTQTGPKPTQPEGWGGVWKSLWGTPCRDQAPWLSCSWISALAPRTERNQGWVAPSPHSPAPGYFSGSGDSNSATERGPIVCMTHRGWYKIEISTVIISLGGKCMIRKHG